MHLDSYKNLDRADHESLARGMGVEDARGCPDGDKSGYDVLGDNLGDVLVSAYRLYGAHDAADVFAAYYVGQYVQFAAHGQPTSDWGALRDHLHTFIAHEISADELQSIRDAIGASPVDV